jgi:hypothetical protein
LVDPSLWIRKLWLSKTKVTLLERPGKETEKNPEEPKKERRLRVLLCKYSIPWLRQKMIFA